MNTNKAKGFVFMAQSIDGFVARKNHDIDWLMKYDTHGEDHGYNNFIKEIDVLVMGTGSYKTVLGFDTWPYTIPVCVLSSTLRQKDIPEELQGKVSISGETPVELMQRLFEVGYKNVYIDGGRVVQSFIKEELIKEITITIIPILIGAGKRMFGRIENDIDFRLMESKSFSKSGFVQNHYKILNT